MSSTWQYAAALRVYLACAGFAASSSDPIAAAPTRPPYVTPFLVPRIFRIIPTLLLTLVSLDRQAFSRSREIHESSHRSVSFLDLGDVEAAVAEGLEALEQADEPRADGGVLLGELEPTQRLLALDVLENRVRDLCRSERVAKRRFRRVG